MHILVLASPDQVQDQVQVQVKRVPHVALLRISSRASLASSFVFLLQEIASRFTYMPILLWRARRGMHGISVCQTQDKTAHERVHPRSPSLTHMAGLCPSLLCCSLHHALCTSAPLALSLSLSRAPPPPRFPSGPSLSLSIPSVRQCRVSPLVCCYLRTTRVTNETAWGVDDKSRRKCMRLSLLRAVLVVTIFKEIAHGLPSSHGPSRSGKRGAALLTKARALQSTFFMSLFTPYSTGYCHVL